MSRVLTLVVAHPQETELVVSARPHEKLVLAHSFLATSAHKSREKASCIGSSGGRGGPKIVMSDVIPAKGLEGMKNEEKEERRVKDHLEHERYITPPPPQKNNSH